MSKYTLVNRPCGWTLLLDHKNEPVRLAHALPSEYLWRQAVQNEIFGDDIRLESIQALPKLRFHISQPYRLGLPPKRETIHKHLMHELGFELRRTIVDEPYFYHKEGIIVADEKPENWMELENGMLVPIDLIIVDLRYQKSRIGE